MAYTTRSVTASIRPAGARRSGECTNLVVIKTRLHYQKAAWSGASCNDLSRDADVRAVYSDRLSNGPRGKA